LDYFYHRAKLGGPCLPPLYFLVLFSIHTTKNMKFLMSLLLIPSFIIQALLVSTLASNVKCLLTP
jgi:hypothetical protein